LASSSSGLSALAICLNKIISIHNNNKNDHENSKMLMEMCRLGSGSSIRSIFNGFAIWHGLFSNPNNL
jgi:mevalonate pyrophosphate decarboxylase